MFLLKKSSHLLAKYTALVIIAFACVTFYQPSLFTCVKGDAQIIVLSLIMLSMGMTLGKEDYRILAQRPFDILIGTIAQYSIMPFVAISIAQFFNLSLGLTLGLVLVGCCPGGVASNIMSFLCKGDVAYSVGMTTVSTILAPVMTPLLLNYLVGETIAMDGWAMFKFMLLVTLVPVGIGSMMNMMFENKKWFQELRELMPGVAVINFAFIVGGVVAVHGNKFLESGFIIFICIVFHNVIGYILGFLAGRLFGMSTAKKRTLSIEVGVQNAGLATGLSSKFFPTNAESAIACAVSCVWHSVSGTILANLFLWWDKRKSSSAVNDNLAKNLANSME
ncbi:bile acid:sodium symporter [Canicola haemoglobinophilus]|uniref:Sodium-dependent transporter n=1 Tax=Canicola haemoglobinophilus TaxID=733 RepID=A0A1V4B030_9PAST|nr:bile acid:sodium symporter family protein [Canicola haemoglobinophilus]OOR99368.1 bile acid:sodium symporter [Canicola haemoglobinophilus]STO53583.1 sodium-dependent transporter [Canicola haemoglobinophilus]STO61010.1 sodium-dependent transporter [Canicola haemoglobinophilus]STO68117.1 sodium-dependent transporter [Canicola haemoglobinophilus]